MPILNEVHSWASTVGGWKCVNSGCTAFITDAQMTTYNIPNANAQAMGGDSQQIVQDAFNTVPANNQL
jgi:hypothetical protein